MIYFVRHGESTSNQEGVFAGQRADVELTTLGEKQAIEAGKKLREQKLQIDCIISSPLKRTMRTAKLLAQEIDYPVEKIKYDARITEYDLGAMTGKSVHGVTPREIWTAEGAEDLKNFRERVVSALNEYSKYNGNILLVSHGGISRMIQCCQKGLESDGFYEQKKFENGEITEIAW